MLAKDLGPCYNKKYSGKRTGARMGDTYAKYADAYKRATKKYDAANTVQIKLKLNLKTDADVIEKLNAVDSKQGYIKELIRRDIANGAEE